MSRPRRFGSSGRAAPGRVRFEVSTLHGQPRAERKIANTLGQLPGVQSVEARALTGNVLVLFDAVRWTPDSLLVASGEALGVRPITSDRPTSPSPAPQTAAPPEIAVRSVVPSGQLRLTVPGLRRAPERERPIVERLQRIDGVLAARANAWTGSVLVQFDPARCTVDALADACAEVSAAIDGSPGRPQRKRSRLRALVTEPRAEKVEVETSVASPSEPGGPLARDGRGRDRRAPGRRFGAGADRTGGRGPARGGLARTRCPSRARPSLIKLLVDQLINAPTALLAAGAGISIVTGGLLEAGLIVVVLGVNAAVGAATERTGQRAIAALRRSAPIRARVRRDGEEQVVDADQLVPGDVIQLLPGDPVPADARIIEAQRLKVEESALTGESRPVDKIAGAGRSAPAAGRPPLDAAPWHDGRRRARAGAGRGDRAPHRHRRSCTCWRPRPRRRRRRWSATWTSSAAGWRSARPASARGVARARAAARRAAAITRWRWRSRSASPRSPRG